MNIRVKFYHFSRIKLLTFPLALITCINLIFLLKTRPSIRLCLLNSDIDITITFSQLMYLKIFLRTVMKYDLMKSIF